MLNPLEWKEEDRVRLLFAAGFGALVGFAADYFPETCGSIYFAHSSALLLLAGRSIVIGLFGSCCATLGRCETIICPEVWWLFVCMVKRRRSMGSWSPHLRIPHKANLIEPCLSFG